MSVKRPHKDYSAPLAHFVSRVCLYYTSFEIHSTQTRVKNKTKHVWSSNFVGLANIMCDEQLKLQNKNSEFNCKLPESYHYFDERGVKWKTTVLWKRMLYKRQMLSS